MYGSPRTLSPRTPRSQTSPAQMESMEPRLLLDAMLETVHFREGGGSGYVDVAFDDAKIVGGSSTNYGSDSNITVRDGTGSSLNYGLIGVAGMFGQIPATCANGGQISILDASLHLFRYNSGTSSQNLYVNRVTSDWLLDSGGSNEGDVSFVYRENSSSTGWASGSFSSADWDASGVSTTWVDNYNQEKVIDVTSLVAAMYAGGSNNGFVVRTDNGSLLNFRASENGSYKPSLQIQYTYTFSLGVSAGSGDGEYVDGTVVDITADAPAQGYVFDRWTGDTSGVTDIYDPTTTITIGTSDVSLTATYVASGYSLTVVNGSGDGSYSPSTQVNVSADAPQQGYGFYCWTGDTAGLADIYDPTTTFTMGSEPATLTAQFSPVQNITDKLRESTTAGYVNLTFDDAELTGGSDTPAGTGGNITIRNDAGSSFKVGLLGLKDLFASIPTSQDGQAVQIIEAKLHLYRYNSGASSDTIYVNRMTSNWLTGDAGTNEGDVTFLHADKSADMHWSAGNFSSADYDASVTASGPFSDTYNGEVVIDVTDLLDDIYATGNNYGLVIRTDATGHNVVFRSAEAGDSTKPYIEITYSYGQPTPMHTLDVGNGSGDGFYWEGQQINLSADSPTSGMAFNMWIGDVGTHNGDTMLDWADQLDAATTYTMPKYDVSIQATYRDADRPLDWTQRWDYIVSNEFGAEKEALTYEAFGSTLVFEADGYFSFVSETSAYLTYETNLPSTGYIEYGTTTNYGNRIEWTDRPTYLHGFHVTGLDNNTTYHYRFVTTDERDNTIASSDATFSTATPQNVNYISGGNFTSPHVISTSGYYLLTGDVTADYTAFEIAADNVTLDLGGHTVVYNDVDYQVSGDFPEYIAYASYGVKATYRSGINIHNGTIVQGDGANAGCTASIGYSPVFLRSSSGEVSGLRVEQCGSQVQGIHLYYSSNLARFNIINDRGGEMINRQAPVSALNTNGNANHNLILRSRQVGITVSNDREYYDNEIYVDSVCTNSFGLYAYSQSGVTMYENRIFGGGYLMIGIGTVSGCSNIDVTDNFVHLQADEPDVRWPEYEVQAGVNGIRQCWGGSDLTYEGNYLICYAQDGGYARGLWQYQDSTTTNITFTNNVFKTVMINSADASNDGSVIITDGGDSSTANYVTFTDNQIISNFCNINHGCGIYSSGCNALYVNNTLVKIGDRDDYRTISFRPGTSTGHQFIDTQFEAGASFGSYVFTDANQDFTVGWTLHLTTTPGATVTVTDYQSTQVFSGTADATTGEVDITLHQYKRNSAGQTFYTPHVVAISKDGYDSRQENVTMDQERSLSAPLSQYQLLAADFGSTAPGNTFGIDGWNTVYLGNYTSYSSQGPGGIAGGWTGMYHCMGVSGPSRQFSVGDVIQVTWYNYGATEVTFTPKVTFDDPDYYNGGSGGTWYDMTQVTVAAGQSVTTTYTVDSGSAGTYSILKACRVLNGASLLCDKIEIL